MNIVINRKGNLSIAEQIVEAFRSGIETKWYVSGDKLPSIRVLSKELSVSAMTIVTAYDRLEKDGFVEKIHGKGVYVLPQKSSGVRSELTTSIEAAETSRQWQDNIRDYVTRSKYAHRIVQFEQQVINMSTAALHSRFLPTDKILEMFYDHKEDFREEFGRYPPVEGQSGFRSEIQKFFNEKGLNVNENQLLITSGSQLGIHLVAETFIGLGDVVVVGAPTFPGAIDVLKGRGAIVIEVPVDEDGLKLDNLMAVCEQYPVKLVYMMANFQNPTGVCLSLERCIELLELADEYNFIILEDDSWSDLSLEGTMRPLKNFDHKGRVIYLGGFSKIFGPSFRLSGMIAEGSLFTRLVAAKSNIDSGAPLLNQLMLTPYINSIECKQHHTWLCHEIRALRNRVVDQLRKSMPSYVHFDIPKGGLVFWLTLPNRFDGKLLYYRCMSEHNISILLGENCYASIRGENQIRLSYTYEEESLVIASIEKIGRIIKEMVDSGPVQFSNPMF